MVKHIVLFRFGDPETDVPVVRDSLLALRGVVPSIVDMEFGTDFLHSERSFDCALIVTFRDRAGLEAYDRDPVHNEARKYIHAHRLDSKTVDFEY